MIMYTTMPHELIFQENLDSYSKQSIINVNGLSLVVEPLSNEECRVVQVLSTNPYDFLNKAYSPGSIIMLKPQF
ncbi:YlzJ-like protein [Schinkia azotoformans MEV2011]|uniref:YlzJ-like protein n=1 Tax=Schinkia azotoformans MEV2011 TaxID=1348973 RepID=A0A072P367_SCHAZ|nr:YlzJ-like family protein [Schinkia azotoformans]KEF39935.1 YlzJ-like protein [Schinkia azotoformans MEV2011]MEC1697234.1 YlzJ-like family protein [Schinkia azotoformans]MEC1715233.1 YlzJ-like family protein [Schinkia azotoformans]MEC1724273.1 YlzJ-like family protein [Schinkia azotoformans]MEC1741016.1 YlzJ-like family protein [Schinkia azotoformans]